MDQIFMYIYIKGGYSVSRWILGMEYPNLLFYTCDTPNFHIFVATRVALLKYTSAMRTKEE